MRSILESRTTMLDDLLARICKKLQINDSQRELAEDRYYTIGKWLSAANSSLVDYKPSIYAQGSLRIDTTVKPLSANEFDLDLVCEFGVPIYDKDPIETLNLIENRLKDHETYKYMLERKKRCICINYANEFHMDILPAYPDPRLQTGCLLVPDREAEDWKESNPKGYAKWFETKCLPVGLMEKMASIEPFPDYDLPQDKPSLKSIVQLIKRYRDIKFDDDMKKAPISIVLTTLAATFYRGELSVTEGLNSILKRIRMNIPQNDRLRVCNPSNEAEDFSEKWDNNPTAYNTFVDWIDEFIKKWDNLQKLTGIKEIGIELKKLFGENLTDVVLAEHAQYVEHLRKTGRLYILTPNIMLSSNAVEPRSVAVAKNTFYGQ